MAPPQGVRTLYPCRLKYCTARSCFCAATRVVNVPRFLRLPDLGSALREYSRYSPDLSLRIIVVAATAGRTACACDTESTRRCPASWLPRRARGCARARREYAPARSVADSMRRRHAAAPDARLRLRGGSVQRLRRARGRPHAWPHPKPMVL